jgi:4-hydroxy-tetrahydrodipicolinate reductase
VSLKVALIGPGRMGREIQALAREQGVEVVAMLGRAETSSGGAAPRSDSEAGFPRSHGTPGEPSAADFAEALAGADVAIDFTAPGAAVDNIRSCVAVECPVVVGTTGWYDRLPEVEALVADSGGSVLWAANFSTGVAVLRALATRAGSLLAGLDDYDVHVVETHHTAKRDAPSGTALVLRDDIVGSLGRPVEITSLRVGHVPGTHEVVVDGPFEQILLRHEARDRRVFADGALRAARWLPGRRGLFTFGDVFA